jgi:hypothetical protein
MKFAGVVLALLVAGCAGYQPARERNFAQAASEGCSNRGEAFIVTAQVSKAYENTVLLADSMDPEKTMSVTLPGRGLLARARGWVGTNKYEASMQRLTELSASRTPVTVTLECKGEKVAPIARNISFDNADGTRTAIAF